MGVFGLMSLIGPAGKITQIEDYNGYTFIVDAMQVIYKYGIAIRNNGKDLQTKRGDTKNHIFAIFNTATFLMKQGIKPIFVFDGKSTYLKNDTIKQRVEKKHYACIKTNTSDNSAEYIKNFKNSYTVPHQHVLECLELLDILGIPYVQAPEEADSQCSALSIYIKKSTSHVVVMSEDSDTLVFGCPKIIKRIIVGEKSMMLEYDLENVLTYLHNKANNILFSCNTNGYADVGQIDRFTHENLIDLAIVLGTDYCNRISSLTTEQVFTYFVMAKCNIQQYEELILYKNMNELCLPHIIPMDYVARAGEIRYYYMNACVGDPSTLDLNMFPYDKKSAFAFLCGKFSFDRHYITKKLKEMSDYYMTTQMKKEG